MDLPNERLTPASFHPIDGQPTRRLIVLDALHQPTDLLSLFGRAEGGSLFRLPQSGPDDQLLDLGGRQPTSWARVIRSLKGECLSRMIFFSEKMLRTAVGQFLDHYHGERNHQGLDSAIIDPGDEVGREDGEIKCRERLGGLLRYYYRDAA